MTDVLNRLTTALADRYLIERELGAGGMATVYLARDLKHERQVAVKVLRPELAAALGPERFLREIKTTAQLNHPHILPLHDSGEADGFLYYVMPYVEGESLRDRLNRERQLSVEDALEITEEVADALSYAHSHDVVHRDIKPENILLSGGHAVVADFGIARAITAAGGEQITQTGFAVGTPAYMSPEQASADAELDGRSDTYSLGCVLYEMLSGEPPYTGPTAQAIIAKRMADPVPSVRRVRETIPPVVDQALTKAMAKVPADRFAVATGFSAALHTPPDGVAVTEAHPSNKPMRIAAAGAVAVVLVAGGVWWSTSNTGAPSDSAISSTRIAVFPATVPGDDSLHLREAWSDLLYRALDGAGELRGVDPNALFPALRRASLNDVDLASAPDLAEQLGAGLYVLSRVVDLGDSITVRSSLYDLSRGPDPVVQADAAGEHEQLSAVVEAVARQLISGHPVGSGARLTDVSTVPAKNYAALKWYVEGERLMRVPNYVAAAEAFDSAIAHDSSLSLAWFRRGNAIGFFSAGREQQVIEEAMQHSAGLGDRDRRMLESRYAHTVRVDAEEALRLTRELVGIYPNDVDALQFRGAILIWNNWRVGRSLGEARSPLERALELDPDHTMSLFFLSWVAGVEERTDEHNVLMGRWLEGQGANPRAPRLRADSAFRFGGRDEQQRITDSLAQAPNAWLNFLARSQVHYLTARRAAELLTDSTRRADPARMLGFLHLAHLDVGQGRWESAKERLVRAAQLAPDYALAYGALLAVTPFLEVPDGELAALRDSVVGWDGELGLDLGTPFDVPDELAPHMRSYLLGLLNARLGDEAEALGYARALEQAVPPLECSRLLPDLDLEIRALSAVTHGDEEGGLEMLEQVELRPCATGQYFTPINTRPYGRMLRADLLQRLRRDEEALGWFSTFGWILGTEWNLYKPYAHLRRAQIYERLMQPDQALDHYAKFVDLWADADPELQPQVESARQRIAALSGERGR